jgi:hypothetical protein
MPQGNSTLPKIESVRREALWWPRRGDEFMGSSGSPRADFAL